MIDIIVNGSHLSIPSDITLTMEQSAPWSDPDNILADTIYTFDIPAEPNALILDHAHSTVVSHHRRYPCQVLFGSLPIAEGQLYVQTAQDELHLSCGITFNPFGLRWGSLKLSENDYGAPIEIVRNGLQSFKQDWRAFLAATLAADSPYKFFLFASDNFSEDEDFSYFRNNISTLENTYVENRFRSYVNRLFFDADGNILECPLRDSDGNTVKQGVRIFNSDSGASVGHKVNGYRFAPALRLVWMAQQVLASASKRLIGEWPSDSRILNLFSQSLCSMDGDVRQYPVIQSLAISTVQSASMAGYGRRCLSFTANSQLCDTFAPVQNGSAAVNATYQFLLPVDDLVSAGSADRYLPASEDYDIRVHFDQYDEAYFLMVATSSTFTSGAFLAKHPDHAATYLATDSVLQVPETSGRYAWNFNGSCNTARHFIQLTSTSCVSVPNSNDDIGGYTMASARAVAAIQQYLDGSNSYHFFLIKAKVYTSEDLFGFSLSTSTGYGTGLNGYNYSRGDFMILSDVQVVDTSTIDYNDTPLNIFSKNLTLSQHLPNLTNAQFLSELIKFFGLSLWIGADTSDIQLDFFASIFDSKALPLDDFIYSAKKINYEPKLYEATVASSLSSKSVRDDYVLDPVDTRDQLPDPNQHKNRHVFVRTENAYLRSARQRDSSGTLTSKYQWEQSGANDQALSVGDSDQDPTDYSSSILCTNMRLVDTAGTTKYIHEVAQQGCSPMFDEDYNGEFPMVLTQYRGRRLLQLQPTAASGVYTQAYIEDANPTFYNPDGTTDTTYINLTATGENSVGELWLRPYLQFLATAEPFELTARIPITTFFTLISLMRPQHGAISEQTRWISYRQQRYLPSRITYSITTADTVVATITCHRELLSQE